MRILFFISILFSLVACQKDDTAVETPSGGNNPNSDLPFLVGESDDFDFHQDYDPPIVVEYELSQTYSLPLDFEGDSVSDFGLVGYTSGSSGGIMTYQIVAYPLTDTCSWEIAMSSFKDSVYVCTDTVPWSHQNGGVIPTYYSSHLNYSCTHPVDTFYRIDKYNVPERFVNGEDPALAKSWSEAGDQAQQNLVYLNHSNTSHFMGMHYNQLFMSYYSGLVQEHYLVFRQRRGQNYRYAWLRLKADVDNRRIELFEMATQGVGKL